MRILLLPIQGVRTSSRTQWASLYPAGELAGGAGRWLQVSPPKGHLFSSDSLSYHIFLEVSDHDLQARCALLLIPPFPTQSGTSLIFRVID